jgi:acyl-CoA dehydrogenase
MIDFEQTPAIAQMSAMMRAMATHQMRPIAREMDENEHSDPTQYFEFIWESTKGYFKENSRASGKGTPPPEGMQAKAIAAPATGQTRQCVVIEQMSWGDAGIYLSTPNPGLGGAAVSAVATPEQKERFLKRFGEGKPKWAAMAITEPGCGSDSAAISTTAVLDGDSWVINGSKIFVTGGKRAVADSEGFVVVWATVDRSAGRAGIKSFVVEHHTPGMTVLKVEKKHGIRCSDTAAIVFENCRIPKNNLLGSAEVVERGEGFKGAMATFDATRPAVAASAIGIGRAALEYVQERFEGAGLSPRYGISPQKLTARERDLMVAHPSRGLDGRSEGPEQPRGQHVQGQGGTRGHAGDPEGCGDDGPGGLFAEASPGEVDARREDQRHLRRHAANQHAHHCPADPRLLQGPAEVGGSWRLAASGGRSSVSTRLRPRDLAR